MDNNEVLNLLVEKFPTDEKELKHLMDNDKLLGQKAVTNYYGKKDLAKQIIKINPLYYDDKKIWWLWDKKNYRWEITDETDILVLVDELAVYNTVKSKEKMEIIEALKQESRKHKPKEIKKTWIQFHNEIFDIKTGEIFQATSEYFVTNPIPYKLHPEKFENTPTIDKIFEEWVGKEHTKTLYEIIAYCLIPDYPINRLFCFVGAGMNGKSCFLNLLKKFVGVENCCSTELDVLLSSRFEITRSCSLTFDLSSSRKVFRLSMVSCCRLIVAFSSRVLSSGSGMTCVSASCSSVTSLPVNAATALSMVSPFITRAIASSTSVPGGTLLRIWSNLFRNLRKTLAAAASASRS